MQSKIMQAQFQQVAKHLNIGKAAYHLYYAPKGKVKNWFRRGVVNTAIDAYSQHQMEQAAYRLPPMSFANSESSLDIHFLTGRKFWYQTCFCAWSLAQHTELTIRPVIYDDGSLERQYQDALLRVFPNAQFFLKQELDERVHQVLPQAKFPCLNERRQYYPNIRKLTDIHAGSHGWKLVLDSDMLFFRQPTLLLEWLQAPETPCHMVDTETAYGYPQALMESLCGSPVVERLNVGICGLNSSQIDWEKLEYWCRKLIEECGTHYYQEQALIAMLMAGQPCSVAPERDYIVMPEGTEVRQPRAILHHYVSDSKTWYFRYGWQQTMPKDV